MKDCGDSADRTENHRNVVRLFSNCDAKLIDFFVTAKKKVIFLFFLYIFHPFSFFIFTFAANVAKKNLTE